jgi:sugar (pentulose or hexulose) kinase
MGGGIPQSNLVLNQIYANVLGKPVLGPSSKVTGIGSAIFAFYFDFSGPSREHHFGDVLPKLMRIARQDKSTRAEAGTELVRK